MRDDNYNQSQDQFTEDGQNYDTSFPPTDNALDLADFDEGFDSTEAGENKGFDPIPDGNYQVNIDRVELKRTKKTNEPMLKWTLRIIGPSHPNRLLWKYHVVRGDNLGRIKKDLYTCNLILDKFSDLPNHFDKLENTKLEIAKKTANDFENVYFNRRIVMGDDNPEAQKDYEQFLDKF